MADDMVRFGAILAGGSGERFWPLSRRDRPKQLLCLADPGRSMLEQAVDRLARVVPRDRIYIVTGEHLVAPILDANPGVPGAHVLAEPCKRNTAGAIAWLTAHLLASHPQLDPARIALATITADHRIGDDARFAQVVDAAMTAAESSDSLVICGIVPAYPETGFGYIQAGVASAAAAAPGGVPVLEVRAFHEKPARDRAEAYLAEGGFYWNSGMFFWRLSAFLGELERARPAMAQAIEAMRGAFARADRAAAAAAFAALDDLSIDHALLERAQRVRMVPGDFPWGDVGLWPAVAALHGTDAGGNCIVGDAAVCGARDTIVYNAAAPGRIAVGVAGVEGLVVVVTGDAVLVVPKDRAGDVRDIVAELRRRGDPRT